MFLLCICMIIAGVCASKLSLYNLMTFLVFIHLRKDNKICLWYLSMMQTWSMKWWPAMTSQLYKFWWSAVELLMDSFHCYRRPRYDLFPYLSSCMCVSLCVCVSVCVLHCVYRLVGLVMRRPPRERKIPGSNPVCAGIFLRVESYQWLKNWHSSGYPARHLALQCQCWDWSVRCQYTVTGLGSLICNLSQCGSM